MKVPVPNFGAIWAMLAADSRPWIVARITAAKGFALFLHSPVNASEFEYAKLIQSKPIRR
jgi:hypothetical protein